MRISAFLFSILVIGLTSFGKDELTANQLPPYTLKIKDIQGFVGYWEEVNSYTIGVTVPNTIDSRITGLVEDLSSNFRTKGTAVFFSGEYKESDENREPTLGG